MTSHAKIAVRRGNHQRRRCPTVEVVATCTTKRSTLHRIDVLFADRVRTAVFVLMALDAQLQIRFLEVAGIGVAMRIVTLRTRIFRVRIITDKLYAV